MEYLHFVAVEINESQPELVVLTHPVHLTLLAMLRHRPKAAIYSRP